jgi:hypothetical protein
MANSDLRSTYNLYCDESCHLEHDKQSVMVLGIVWCRLDKSREIAQRIREIKTRHALSPKFEIKWSKVSPAGLAFYRDIIDYFFDDDHLHFRVLVAHKDKLRHDAFAQSHDQWYHKMYFLALQTILAPQSSYRIYFDIKDSRSGANLAHLHEILCNNIYDFRRRVIERVQGVHSDHVEQVQLADLLIGAVGYINRNLTTSTAKTTLIERIQKRSNYSLVRNTLLREEKFNIFHWNPSGEE